ncbi:kinase-like domain protein [Dichotomopilus funicola]|uniref:non-specific serine/threonine protein kinase n=1 Tax=Dichotomopilus funicola TaxID=1934379 RepID=A0AAN6V9T5_9PEZI|nr:kinase-like domain protein [Dichotomopilus funicola]
MEYRLSSGTVIEPSSAILVIDPVPGVTESELIGRNEGRVGHLVDDALLSGATDHGDSLIVLSLSHPPRLGEQFVLGSDAPTTDIVLGVPGRKVSARHLSFGFDEQDRVIMLDTSRLGTSVSYNDQPLYARRGTPGRPFRWVLPIGYEVRVEIEPSFRFNIRVQDHSSHLEEFRAKLESFRHECRTRVPEVSNIDLDADLPVTASALTPASPGSGLPNSAATTNLETPDDKRLPGPEVYVEGPILGRGGNGTVNKFYAVRDWTCYAGKRIAHDVDLEYEVDVLKKLSHPRIVRYVDTFEETQTPLSTVLIMEYCAEKTLAHQYRKRELQMEETLLVLQQCLEALVYLHESNITHRDIKPQNILFRSRNPIDVALADFGWASNAAGSMSTAQIGTITYLAPEVLAHQRYRNPIDIWSLGVVGLEYLEELPDEEECEDELDFAIEISGYAESLATDYPSHGHLLLLSQMLSRKPAKRPTAVECLRAVSDLVAQATPPTTPSPLSPLTRGSREPTLSDSQATVRAPRNSQYTQTTVRRWIDRTSPRNSRDNGDDLEDGNSRDNGDDLEDENSRGNGDDQGNGNSRDNGDDDSRNRRSDVPPPETPQPASSVVRLASPEYEENYSLGAGQPEPQASSVSAVPAVSALRKRNPDSSGSGPGSNGSDRHARKRQATSQRLSLSTAK